MNTAVVRGGIVNVPVLLLESRGAHHRILRERLHGMQQQRLLPEGGIGEVLQLRRGVHQHHGL